MKNIRTAALHLLVILVAFATQLQAQNQTLGVQGVVKNSNGTAIDNGDHSLTFKLYDVETGGTSLWDETQTVEIQSGVYSALIGETTPLPPFNKQLYLGVKIAGGTEMLPRSVLSAAPYALSLLGNDNVFPNTGSVGIGTISPTNKLHVVGTMKLEGSYLEMHDPSSGDGGVALTHGSNDKLIINQGGWFGGNVEVQSGIKINGWSTIGTITPSVGIGLQINNGDPVDIPNNPTSGHLVLGDIGVQTMGLDGNTIQIKTSGGAGTLLLNPFGGKIGIGGAATKAILEIHGSQQETVANFGFLDNDGADNSPGPSFFHYGLWSHGAIGASLFTTFSDARIKDIQGVSDTRSDLATLCQIEITDYLHRDIKANGEKPQKKVIGQQVAKVFPQAVDTDQTQFVPDFLFNTNIKNSWVALPDHDLKVGEKVRMIFKDSIEELEVLAINENTFQTTSTRNEKVVVYGREVHDFHVVDYQAIAMLNVSATQELARQNNDLQKQNETMKKEIETLKTQLKTQSFTAKEMVGLRAMLSQ